MELHHVLHTVAHQLQESIFLNKHANHLGNHKHRFKQGKCFMYQASEAKVNLQMFSY